MKHHLVFAHPKYEPVVAANQTRITLDHIQSIDDGSCPEIILADTLDYVQEREQILALVSRKLMYGGEMVVTGVDANLAAKGIVNGQIEISGVRDLMYNQKQSIDTLDNMLSNLTQLGLEPLEYSVRGYFFNVKARRPEAKDDSE